MKRISQRCGAYPIPGKIHGQAGRALNNLVELKTSLLIAGGLELDDLQRSFPIRTIQWIYDSIISLQKRKKFQGTVMVFKVYTPGEVVEIVEKTVYKMDKPGLTFLRRLS